MERRTCWFRDKTRPWWGLPELQLVGLGLGLSVAWEFLQSPFYTDTFEATWGAMVFNRLHCAGGDVFILLMAFWLVSLRWGRGWMGSENRAPLSAFLVMGVIYTASSEYFNVHLVQRWAYSQWMPTIVGIGLVPLVQWIVIPALIVLCVKRRLRRQRCKELVEIAH